MMQIRNKLVDAFEEIQRMRHLAQSAKRLSFSRARNESPFSRLRGGRKGERERVVMESLKRALENIGRMWANLNTTAADRHRRRPPPSMVVLHVVSSLGTSQAWVRVAGGPKPTTAVPKKLQERNQKHDSAATRSSCRRKTPTASSWILPAKAP
jgi:hypothetical protein